MLANVRKMTQTHPW